MSSYGLPTLLLLCFSGALAQAAECSGNTYSNANVSVSGATILKDGSPWIATGAVVTGLITTRRNYAATVPMGPRLAEKFTKFGSATLRAIRTVMHGDTARFQVHQSVLDPQSTHYDPTYLDSVIAPALKTARDLGLVVDLSVQHSWGLDSPDFDDYPTDTTFRSWKQLAVHFRCDRGVIFELYNEPRRTLHVRNWWLAWGMEQQPIIDYIRSTGARNAIIVDGPEQLLSGIRQTGLHDPLNALIYSVHPYPTKNGNNAGPSKWYPNFGFLAGRLPLWIGEWAMTSEISCRRDLETFVVRFLDQIKAWRIPLLGWAMDVPNTLTRNGAPNFQLTSYKNFSCGKGYGGGPGLTLQHYFMTGEVSLL